VRTLIRNLRIGANWRSVLGPLARAALLHRQDAAAAGKAAQDDAAAAGVEAFHVCPDLGLLVPVLLEGGPAALRCGPGAGTGALGACAGCPEARRLL
jgi:DNA ligase-1